ncbi:MAG: adenosylcobinamide-GDP ribazoletransferase, partial [Pseudomonadota bacterium]
MYKHDTPLLEWHDLPAALGLLTRFPVIVDGKRAAARGAAAAWAYPLVGVILGVVLASTVPFMLLLGLAPSVIAGLLLALQVILTGAMHEDGLADAADGLWGGWTKERRLDIMKDSRIGVYGVCALMLTLFLRWMALFTIVSVGAYWVALIAVGALSRATMVVLMGVMPNARGGGLSQSVGRPREGTV